MGEMAESNQPNKRSRDPHAQELKAAEAIVAAGQAAAAVEQPHKPTPTEKAIVVTEVGPITDVPAVPEPPKKLEPAIAEQLGPAVVDVTPSFALPPSVGDGGIPGVPSGNPVLEIINQAEKANLDPSTDVPTAGQIMNLVQNAAEQTEGPGGGQVSP